MSAMWQKFPFKRTVFGVPWAGSEELWSQAAHSLLRAGYAVGHSEMD